MHLAAEKKKTVGQQRKRELKRSRMCLKRDCRQFNTTLQKLTGDTFKQKSRAWEQEL